MGEEDPPILEAQTPTSSKESPNDSVEDYGAHEDVEQDSSGSSRTYTGMVLRLYFCFFVVCRRDKHGAIYY